LSEIVTDTRKTGLTVALSHLLFNILGMLVWYPIPMVRNIPIAMAKMNGNMAADLKWWPWAYIVVVFLVMPAFLLGVSAVHWGLFAFVGFVLLVIITGAIVICYLRLNKPTKLPLRFQADPQWLPNSLRINKTAEAAELESVPAAVQDADIGKDDWRAAPVAWGGGWFVLFALLVALTNAKWADIKFPAFDKRDHVGFSAWKTCSYSFKENDMVWAKPYDLTQCTDAVLANCASKSMATCHKHISFSNVPDVNKDYEASWIACRETCPMFKWSQWCENQACGGTLHLQQCQNVSSAVMRPYVVEYGPSGSKHAWKKGDMCRDFDDICDNGKSVKVAGDCGVVGLVCVILGQITVIAYNSMHKKRDMTMVLASSLGCWCVGWLFCFVSWTTYLSASNAEATCVVEDVSHTGAVLATGAFKDIAGSSYTFGCVVGSWLMLKVIILAVGLRLTGGSKHSSPSGEAEDALSTKTESTAAAVAPPLATKTESTTQPQSSPQEIESKEMDI